MKHRVKVEMKPVNTILARIGVDSTGRIQRFVTNTINRRITAYMGYKTGFMATKAKIIKSPTEIEVSTPYARYNYYGKLMVGPAPKTLTDVNLQYDQSHNPNAGPFWDRRMMAAEKKQIAQEATEYARRQKT